jgi:MipA family protein
MPFASLKRGLTVRCSITSACLRTACLLLLSGAELTAAQTASSGDKQLPLWELGFGVAALRIPDYRGSDQSSNYLLPVPYAIYRGKFLKADREGARAILLDAQRVEVDVSVAAAVPARHNAAREGMPELAPRVEIGPSANLDLYRRPDDRVRLRLQAPLRAAFTLERSFQDAGVSFTPHLNLDLKGLGGGWDLGVQAGPIFANRRFHDYLYGVDPAYATAQRPAYVARGGYAGWVALTGISRRFNDTWVGAFVRYDSLRGAVIASSPLVRSDHALTMGFGVAWVFAVSEQRVAASQ